MKLSVIWVCALAVLLWTGARAVGQGKGKDQGQGGAAASRAAEAGKAPQVPQAGQTPAGKPGDKIGQGKQALEDRAAKAKREAGEKAGQAKGAIEKGKAKGKDHRQQLQAFDKQLQQAQGKHMERQARLARIRELAVKKGDTETIARVDKVIAKEQQVFGRKLLHLQGQKRAIEQPQTEGQPAPAAPVAPPQAVPGKTGTTK